MRRSLAWDDIQPAMLSSSPHASIPTKKSVANPDKLVDILIDASEQYFIEKAYKPLDVERYCKKYLKDHKCSIHDRGALIEKVVSYFRLNRLYIANDRQRYRELPIDPHTDIGSLPGGVCNKVAYLLRRAQVIEHYEKNRDTLAPGENQE